MTKRLLFSLLTTLSLMCYKTFTQEYHFALEGPNQQTITEKDFADKY